METDRLNMSFESKINTGGVARQQLHFLCVDERKRSKRKRPQTFAGQGEALCPVPSLYKINPAKARTRPLQKTFIGLRQLALSLWINFTPLGGT